MTILAATVALVAALTSMTLMARSRQLERVGEQLRRSAATTDTRYDAFEATEKAAAFEHLAWSVFAVEIFALIALVLP